MYEIWFKLDDTVCLNVENVSSKITVWHKFKRGTEEELVCYVDADWGSNSDDRKSVTGFLFKNFGNTICWATRKQHCITLSTTEESSWHYVVLLVRVYG